MNWSDGANFYLLKTVSTYGKDWSLVCSALSVIANTFLRHEKLKDFSDKSCSIQYKYLIASTRQIEERFHYLKEEQLLQIALVHYAQLRQDQIRRRREYLVARMETEREENRKLLAGRFSEIAPESILAYRKRLRAFCLQDVIADTLHLDPLPADPEEDKVVRRTLQYADLPDSGFCQAMVDEGGGLWIPVGSNEMLRNFFEVGGTASVIDGGEENEFDEGDEISPPVSPCKTPKLELSQTPQYGVLETAIPPTNLATHRPPTGATNRSLSVTGESVCVSKRPSAPLLPSPVSSSAPDRSENFQLSTSRTFQKRWGVLKTENHLSHLRTHGRSKHRSQQTTDTLLAHPASAISLSPAQLAPRRRWRRGLLSALTTVCSHRHAHIFLHPVTDEIAPGYSGMIYSPVDLTGLRRCVESSLAPLTTGGEETMSNAQMVVAQTAKQFLRDLLLMFANARMYNNREHSVHRMAGEMCADVLAELRPLWTLWSEDISDLPPLPGSPEALSGLSSMLRRRSTTPASASNAPASTHGLAAAPLPSAPFHTQQ
uniref:Bromo domain-containing protein n=2 Tax=Mesocestoides corti TaxID=53468 RepID=A0A5K3FP52_MESCO